MNIKLVNKLYSNKKVLLILLFVAFLLPKNVYAFTVTYKSMEGMFDDGSLVNVVEYDQNHNIVSGTYKEPTIIHSCGDKKFTQWFYDLNMQNQFYLRDEDSDVTVYAGYNRLNMCFDYLGRQDAVMLRRNSNYRLEVWGAQGGTVTHRNVTTKGGYGGYSTGSIALTRDRIIYINVGGAGVQNDEEDGVLLEGGYNGGGNNRKDSWGVGSTGGGATHMALSSGLLRELEDDKESVLIVAGAGGSGGVESSGMRRTSTGGHGGGYIGNKGTSTGGVASGAGGTQTSGAGFGRGNLNDSGWYGAAGAGWYGGYFGCGAGGGSGYIGTSDLTNKSMYCYGCTEALDPIEDKDIFTVSTTGSSEYADKNSCPQGYSAEPISKCAKLNNGYAKIILEDFDDNLVMHKVTFRHEGEDAFIGYVKDGEKINEPNIYLTSSIGESLHSWEIDGTDDEWDFDDPVTGDLTLRTYKEKITYTINYNLGPGTVSNNPSTYTIDDLPIIINNPTPEIGYTFIGWSGTGLNQNTMSITITESNIGDKEYVANYQADPHTATFDSNLGNVASPETITKGYKEELGVLPIANRIGYIFEGWFTEPDGGTQITSSTTMPAYNPTYYAHWTPITYTIHFNSNNGTGSMESETFTYGTTKALNKNTFTRLGWTFAGWNTWPSGIGTNYVDEQDILNLTDTNGIEITLYAKWTKDEYLISYNLDGGQFNNPRTTYSVDDEEFTLVKPSKEGFIFLGWTGTDVSIPTKNVVVATGSTGNREYIANWTEVIYTIEYIRNYDNSIMNVFGNTTEYKITDTDIILNNPENLDPYYDFVGWTTNLDTESDLSSSFVIPSGSMGNIKVYAIFQASQYTVSFDSDGGNNINPITKLGTEDIGTLPIPVKNGYTFKGWFINEKVIDQTFHPRVDTIVIAKWEKNPEISSNPGTNDNIIFYIIILLISVIGLYYTHKLKLKIKKA